MKLSRTRMLFVGMLVLSIIIFLQGKSFVPIACYFLIMAAIIEVMIVEIDQYKFKEYEIQNLKVEQMDWIHKELNQACESNDIEELKKTLHNLDSKLYLLHNHVKKPKEAPENVGEVVQKLINLTHPDHEAEVIQSYMIRQVRRFKKHGYPFVRFHNHNSKYFKKQQQAYEYLVDRLDEMKQFPNPLDVVVTKRSITIYF